MTPVFQTIFDQNQGNCMQACVASIFDLKLEDVPNFINYRDWKSEFCDFFHRKGYGGYGQLENPNHKNWHNFQEKIIDNFRSIDMSDHALPEEYSINGYYLGVVYSPKFYKEGLWFQNMHQVICDKFCNVVHDPNPKYVGVKYPLSFEFGDSGVILIDVFKKYE